MDRFKKIADYLLIKAVVWLVLFVVVVVKILAAGKGWLDRLGVRKISTSRLPGAD